MVSSRKSGSRHAAKKVDQPPLTLSYNRIVKNNVGQMRRVFIAVGLTGLVRAEWMFSRYGQVIPCNWTQTEHQMWLPTYGPMGFLVAEARNMAVREFLRYGFEWLFFIDHDTCLPPNFFIKANERMIKQKIPVWSGLYFTKSMPSEPLVYRTDGGGYFGDWKMGDQVWTTAVPMGCTLIHRSILKVMYDDAEPYMQGQEKLRRVFETPQKAWVDPESGQWNSATGTEDLNWSWRVMREGYFKKAGWPEYQRKKYPFLVDTSLFCKHVDEQGILYPANGEEKYFERKKSGKKDK